MHQPVTVSSNKCSQMHAQIKYALSHLQDLIPTLVDAIANMYVML